MDGPLLDRAIVVADKRLNKRRQRLIDGSVIPLIQFCKCDAGLVNRHDFKDGATDAQQYPFKHQRDGHNAIRISTHFYNNTEQIDKAVDLLLRLRGAESSG